MIELSLMAVTQHLSPHPKNRPDSDRGPNSNRRLHRTRDGVVREVSWQHPRRYSLEGVMNYSNSRVHGYGLLGDLYLIIDNLNDYFKTFHDKRECYGTLPRGEVEEVSIVVYWLET